MKKQTTEKKEFAWDTEKKIGEFGDNKKKTEVRVCTLNGKTFVSTQSYVMSAKTGGWKRTKNNTMEMGIFKELQEFVGKWEMMDAFGSTTELQAPAPKKELKAKKAPAKEKELKAPEKKKAASKASK